LTREEHKTLLTQIRNAENDATRIDLLMKVEADYSNILTEHDTAINEKNEAIGERDRYAKLNNDLWLQNSAQGALAQNQGEQGEQGGEEQAPPQKTYGDLESLYEQQYKGE